MGDIIPAKKKKPRKEYSHFYIVLLPIFTIDIDFPPPFFFFFFFFGFIIF